MSAKKIEENNVEVATEVTYNVEELMQRFKTKSAVIRYLDSEKLSRGAIAKLLNIRYQHVRNVLITPIKKTTV